MFGRGAATPSVTSRFLDLTLGEPSSSALAFSPPHDAHLRSDDVVDLADAANRFASRVPPRTLAGLPQRAAPAGRAHGAVGVYGRGPTLLLAVPLWHRSADRVCEDLLKAPGTRKLDAGLLVAAPPLRLLLANPEPNDSAWLLAGTVTRRALVAAAAELAANPPGLSFR